MGQQSTILSGESSSTRRLGCAVRSLNRPLALEQPSPNNLVTTCRACPRADANGSNSDTTDASHVWVRRTKANTAEGLPTIRAARGPPSTGALSRAGPQSPRRRARGRRAELPLATVEVLRGAQHPRDAFEERGPKGSLLAEHELPPGGISPPPVRLPRTDENLVTLLRERATVLCRPSPSPLPALLGRAGAGRKDASG